MAKIRELKQAKTIKVVQFRGGLTRKNAMLKRGRRILFKKPTGNKKGQT